MADIQFDIKVVGSEQLKRAADDFDRLGRISSKLSAQYKPLAAQTNRLVQEQNRLAGVKKQLAKAVKDEVITSNAATRAFKEQVRVSNERVRTDKVLIAQARKKQRAEAAANKEIARLTRAYAPARMAQEQYARSFEEITQAAKAFIITEAEATQAVANLDREFRQFEKGLATGGNQFARFNVETYKAIQARKRFASVGAQQAGYQVGDFFIQLQSGTNIAVAFGQQMSQLLGIFGAFGAVAGAGVAIATAFIAPLLEAKKKTNEVEQALGTLFSSLQTNATSMEELIDTKLTGSLEQARLKAIETRKVLEKIFLQDIQTAAAQAGLPILDELIEFSKDLRKDKGLFSRLTGAVDIAGFDDEKLAADLDKVSLQISKALLGPVEELPAALLEALKVLEASPLNVEGSTVANAVKTLGRFAAEQGLDVRAEKDIVEAIKDKKKLEAEYSEMLAQANQEAAASYEKAQEERDKQEEHQKKVLKYYYELNTARDAALNRVPFFINDESLKDAVKIYKERQKAEKKAEDDRLKALQKQADAERRLFEENLAYETEQVLIAGRELGDEAEKLGKRLAISFQQALKFINDAKTEAAVSTDIFGTGNIFTQDFKYTTGFKFKPEKKKENREAERLQEFMMGLTDRIEKEELLLGLFDEERDLKEQQIDAMQEYGDVATSAQMKAIDGHLAEIQAIQQKQQVLEDNRRQILEYNEFMAKSFEDTFMSVIDGTSDLKTAMKKLVSDLISEFMRMMVIKPLMNSIFGGGGPISSPFFAAFGLANGGIMNRGNLVPFEQGGVVGGPTTFPMYGGKTGLMGEAGPEAIMPLRRGAGGRLGVEASGSGGDIVINHNFNFTANGDDSVKRIIAQSMPDITEATKASVLDARKRGGQFRRVFT